MLVVSRAAGVTWMLVVILLITGCERQHERPMYLVAGADPARGPALMRSHGCHACHTVPGVTGADALVGPPLIHWSRRTYIAGMLPNTPDNLITWIRDPRSINPRTAMPYTGLSESDARDIAAYLFTLE